MCINTVTSLNNLNIFYFRFQRNKNVRFMPISGFQIAEPINLLPSIIFKNQYLNSQYHFYQYGIITDFLRPVYFNTYCEETKSKKNHAKQKRIYHHRILR